MIDTTVKSQVLKVVEEMPPNVTFIDIFIDIMERLYFIYKIDRGLQQVEAGDTLSHEEAKKRIN